MRFDADTCQAIHDATPGSATIRWPAGAEQPEPGRVYWMQSRESLERAEAMRDERSETCREAMAKMYRRRYGRWPDGYKPRRKKSVGRPKNGDPMIKVVAVTILEVGWEAEVTLFEDPDPRRHTGLKTRVPAGLNPIDGFAEKVELESEQMVEELSPVVAARRRAEEKDALKTEHEASIDQTKIAEAERSLADQRRRGKTGDLQRVAIERSRKRAELASAEQAA